MKNIVVFGAPHTGKTTLMGYLATAMLPHPEFNDAILENLKKIQDIVQGDIFHIGNPKNPINVHTEVILPSFVSLDKEELMQVIKHNSSDTSTNLNTKRQHRKQLSICLTEATEIKPNWALVKNASTTCTFIDMPGYSERTSFRYRGFFEGDFGIAVISLRDILNYMELREQDDAVSRESMLAKERSIFEPLRIWCGYKDPNNLIIALSKIDEIRDGQKEKIEKAIKCIHANTGFFNRGVNIPISPISISVKKEANYKKSRTSVFFKRNDTLNIYSEPKSGVPLPGDGTLISCLTTKIGLTNSEAIEPFVFASIDRLYDVKVNYSPKTTVGVKAVHGSLDRKQPVYMGPVKIKGYDDAQYMRCKIASVKRHGSSSVSDYLYEGNVGGVMFEAISDLSTSRAYELCRDKKKTEIKLLPTSGLFADISDVISGGLIVLDLMKDDYVINSNGDYHPIYTDSIRKILPYELLSIFWYGKKIEVQVAAIENTESKIRLTLRPADEYLWNADCFTVPRSNAGGIKYVDNILLGIQKNIPAKKRGDKGYLIFTYVNTNLVDIKNINCCSELKLTVDSSLKDRIQLLSEDVGYSDSQIQEEAGKLSLSFSLAKRTYLGAALNKIRRQFSNKARNGTDLYNDDITLTLS